MKHISHQADLFAASDSDVAMDCSTILGPARFLGRVEAVGPLELEPGRVVTFAGRNGASGLQLWLARPDAAQGRALNLYLVRPYSDDTSPTD